MTQEECAAHRIDFLDAFTQHDERMSECFHSIGDSLKEHADSVVRTQNLLEAATRSQDRISAMLEEQMRWSQKEISAARKAMEKLNWKMMTALITGIGSLVGLLIYIFKSHGAW